jgi:hypothetical protein
MMCLPDGSRFGHLILEQLADLAGLPLPTLLRAAPSHSSCPIAHVPFWAAWLSQANQTRLSISSHDNVTTTLLFCLVIDRFCNDFANLLFGSISQVRRLDCRLETYTTNTHVVFFSRFACFRRFLPANLFNLYRSTFASLAPASSTPASSPRPSDRTSNRAIHCQPRDVTKNITHRNPCFPTAPRPGYPHPPIARRLPIVMAA